jgi:hypothetical protein
MSSLLAAGVFEKESYRFGHAASPKRRNVTLISENGHRRNPVIT